MSEVLLLALGAVLVGLIVIWLELRAIRRAAERLTQRLTRWNGDGMPETRSGSAGR